VALIAHQEGILKGIPANSGLPARSHRCCKSIVVNCPWSHTKNLA